MSGESETTPREDAHAREETRVREEPGEREETPTDEEADGRPKNLAYEQARLAYTIIQALLEHARVTQDLVALMAQTLDEDTQKALVNTPHWAAYLDSRRALERTREDVEKFAEVWTRLAEELEPPTA